MRKQIVFLVTLAVLLTAQWCYAAQFRLIAPAEESFLGMSDIIIIGKVEGFTEAKMVEIFDNGKTLGFAPLNMQVFTFNAKLPAGRHEIALAAPGVKRKTIKAFIGKQEGYQYHIEPNPSSCSECHPGSSKGEYKLPYLQGDLCAECHDRVSGGKFVHGPVAAGSCTPCHDPHGSRNEKFLAATGKELCLACHSQDMSTKHIEERANANCTKCHDPHSSAREFHLH